MKIFLLLAGLDGIIDAADIPTGSKAAEWNSKDHKVYVCFFFLIKPNYCLPVIKIKSVEKLFVKYEKDSATLCMVLCQQFYSLMHDPAVVIIIFIGAILSIVQQLGAIGHKPDVLKISNKLLIRLHKS